MRFPTGTVHSLGSFFASLKRFSKSLALWVPSHSSPLRLGQHIGICLPRRFFRASNFIVFRRSYNNLPLVRTLAVLICGVVITLPSVASARQTTPRQSAPSTQSQQVAAGNANFCSSIDTISDKIMKDITLRETRYATIDITVNEII